MTYPITPVPHSTGTADGYFAKTDKSRGFQWLTSAVEDENPPPAEKTLLVEDGNALFYCMKEVPSKFRQIGHKYLTCFHRKVMLFLVPTCTVMTLSNPKKDKEEERVRNAS